jgi:hypothetical protein
MHSSIDTTKLAETIRRGLLLSETPMGLAKGGRLSEAKGWKEYCDGVTDPNRRAFMATMLENYRKRVSDLSKFNEATTSMNVGTFDKWAFPVLSIVSENLVAADLFTTQPLDGPQGLVFYMNFITGMAKGSTPAGAKVWDARTGHADRMNDGANTVHEESIGTTDVSGDIASTSLAWFPVIPGSVSITLDPSGTPVLVTDNGNGVIVDGSNNPVGSINYNNGAVALNTTSNSVPVVASYNYNPETNTEAQLMDVEIQSSQIICQERKHRIRWSMESARIMEALHSVNAENLLSTAVTNELQWSIDRELIETARTGATAGMVTWDNDVPAGQYVGYVEHKYSYVDALIQGSSYIQRATNRARANWYMCGMAAQNIVESLPNFEPAGDSAEIEGVAYLGKLGHLKVYSDPHFPVDEGLLGYKGNDLVRAGLIFAPWLLSFSTPVVTLDDFFSRKGFASSYGKKMINSGMYALTKITNYGNQFSQV